MSLSVFETPVFFRRMDWRAFFCVRYVLLFAQTSAILELFTQTRSWIKGEKTNSYQKQYADALRMAIKRKTKKDADEWLDQQKVPDGKTRIAMKKAYIEGRLSNLTDESIVSLYEIMDSIYMSDLTECRGEESTEEILEKLYDVQVK